MCKTRSNRSIFVPVPVTPADHRSRGRHTADTRRAAVKENQMQTRDHPYFQQITARHPSPGLRLTPGRPPPDVGDALSPPPVTSRHRIDPAARGQCVSTADLRGVIRYPADVGPHRGERYNNSRRGTVSEVARDCDHVTRLKGDTPRKDGVRWGKTRKTMRDRVRQSETMRDRVRQGKTWRDTARQSKNGARQDETRRDRSRQGKTEQDRQDKERLVDTI